MGLDLDVRLDPEEAARVEATDPRSWFTHVSFANTESPRHPGFAKLEANHGMKRQLVGEWLGRVVPGRSVLDTFCANGAFSFEAARLGASSVLGVDFDPPRIETAQLTADMVRSHGWDVVPDFRTADVYRLEETVPGGFDVTLCLGGLYHVADPLLVLGKLREVTADGGTLVLQTSGIIWVPGRWAQLRVRRRDRRAEGFSSIRGGQGAWVFTWRLVSDMLSLVGFEVVEQRFPPLPQRKRFPWYCALARAV